MANDMTASLYNLSKLKIGGNMDALASDLSHALDETTSSLNNRRRRSYKRRAKLPQSVNICPMVSEDSSSSIDELIVSNDKSVHPVSDSDDLSPLPSSSFNCLRSFAQPAKKNIHMPLAESDSFNENFSPKRLHNRRKRRCKRLAVECESSILRLSSTATSIIATTGMLSSAGLVARKKKSEAEHRHVSVLAGKRKRCRERNLEYCNFQHVESGSSSGSVSCSGTILQKSNLNVTEHGVECNGDCMDYQSLDEDDEYMLQDASGTSSCESEGLVTCDEAREADDEHSDWVAEAEGGSGAGGVSGTYCRIGRNTCWGKNGEEGSKVSTATAKALLKERYESMSIETQQACRQRFQKLRERLLRREIRAGRRRLRDRRPGFCIVSSVNDKVSRFLQDPTQLELHLKPLNLTDRDQLNHLASLYCLNVSNGDDVSAPILTKTCNTITTQLMEEDELFSSFPGGIPTPLSDLKRRRRTPTQVLPSREVSEALLIVGSESSIERKNCEDDGCCSSLSERLADSEPDPLPSPSSLSLHKCTL